jgi:GNAT superfamily N-acetyltransferase
MTQMIVARRVCGDDSDIRDSRGEERPYARISNHAVVASHPSRHVDTRLLKIKSPFVSDSFSITIRRARRGDVEAIVRLLADDPLGGPRERVETPLPDVYFNAFARLSDNPHVMLMVAESETGEVVGCLQLCILPGLSSQGASRGLIEDVRVAARLRSRGIGEKLVRWAIDEARRHGCKLVELLTHQSRIDAQRFYARLGFAASHAGMTIRFQA